MTEYTKQEYTKQEDINTLSILETIRSLNKLNDVGMILERTLFEARTLANADAGSIYISKDNSLHFSHVQNDTLFNQRGARAAQQYSNVTIPINNDTIVGHSALTKKIVVIEDAYQLPADAPYHFNPIFDKENNYHTTSILTIPLLSPYDIPVGVIQLINAHDEEDKTTVFSEYSITATSLFANNAAMSIERALMNRKIILRMVKMAALHDPKETGAHVQRVSAFSAEIYQHWAEKKQLPVAKVKYFRDLISLGAMLHDAGKVGISDTILKKPSKLTEEEFTVLKKHTIYGAQLFKNISTELDKMIYEIALHHHEKWNGQGYPGRREQLDTDEEGDTLAGEEIPLAARIVGLADVFDALSSSRCYKEPWEKEKVYEVIHCESGKHFDPELIEVFFEIIDILCAIQQKYQ
ncbi:MAG: HD domain-containing protein [Desulfocapsa sp.]|nr:HD domain-containing protein [Desulfocapsa sp.]